MPVGTGRGHTRWPRLLTGIVASGALVVGSPARAQLEDRAALEWRTLESAHFRYLFPQPLTPWALPVAARFEAVRAAVDAAVGSAPGHRVTVVMDDPVTLSNGLTIPELRHPTLLFLATPPGPRSEIGDNPGWGEILSVHEYAHAAHLTWPSRNPLMRRIEDLPLLPTDIGPLVGRTPRWAIEGYATYLEGRLTGSGRPHGVWRAAVLREWALEGKLPTYAGMSGTSGYRGGSFAYLAGSAYLEWLVGQRGDSALSHLWRRLSARRQRTFAAAFAGVFGGLPGDLYDRFRVDVTERSLAVRRTLSTGGLAEGDLVQALDGSTGDPAVSRDGSHIAIVLRPANRSPRVVVWNAAAGPDTAEERRIARMLARDPEDVAPVVWRPPPRRTLATLWPAAGGWTYDHPRFLPDGDHILLTRFVLLPDGSRRPDLFIWDWRQGSVRRVTRAAAIVDADPTPDGANAVAVRCFWGVCDLVHVDLATGAVRLLAPGAPDVVWSRPRVAHDGRRVAAARQMAGRWSVVLVDAATGAIEPVGPEDGVQRYDATFLPGDTALVVTSEAGGIPNLEILRLADGSTRPITRVTGAAMAPEPKPDGDILFLRLQGKGLDLARVPAAMRLGPVVALDSALTPAAPLPWFRGDGFSAQILPRPAGYGLGPRVLRLIPWVGVSASGVSGSLALASSDPVGRLGWLAQGAFGPTAWTGGSLQAVYRGLGALWPVVGAFAISQRPGRVDARGDSTGMPGRLRYEGIDAAFELRRLRSASGLVLRLGGSAGRLDTSRVRGRGLGWLDVRPYAHFASGTSSASVALGLNGSVGRTGGASWSRGLVTAAALLDPGEAAPSIELLGLAGLVRGGGLLERFAVGGEEPPLFDPSIVSQQIAMPALDEASVAGRRVVELQARLGAAGFWAYGWGARASETPGWQRVLGVEQDVDTPAVPLLALPGVHVRLGMGYTLDEKPHRAVRVYGTAVLHP